MVPKDLDLPSVLPRWLFVILIASIAIFFAVGFYSSTVTVNADLRVAPFAAAIAVLLLAILVLLQRIDTGRAKDGLLVSLYSLLPDFLRWAGANRERAFLSSGILLGASYAFIWLGPSGVATYSVACGEAREIRFSFAAEGDELPCEEALTSTVWLAPHHRTKLATVSCITTLTEPIWTVESPRGRFACGPKPREARFITDGIQFLADGTALEAFRPVTSIDARMDEGVKRLRSAMRTLRLPERRYPDNVTIATWNIRALGGGFRSKPYGSRMRESYAYIAEILSHFDIIAVQEMHDAAALRPLLAHLGGHYAVEFGPFSPGPAGNKERLGFIYDTRKVRIGEYSSTLVISKDIEGSTSGQPARPPFLAEFIVRDRRFFLTTAHIYFGQPSGPKFERRLNELAAIAQELDLLSKRYFQNAPILLLGDLNVSKSDGREISTLRENKFDAPVTLVEAASNHRKTRPYDQILLLQQEPGRLFLNEWGTFHPLDHVFRKEDESSYRAEMARLAPRKDPSDPRTFEQFRTFQISDHGLKWASFRADW